MVKRIVLAILFFATLTISAQNGTVSPYSAFGIGDLRQGRSIENQSMGGIGFYTDSIHIHLNNPAALGKLGLATYTGALSRKEYRMETADDAQRTSVTNLDYLSIAFPLIAQRAGMAFGAKPFSSVGYQLEDRQELDNGDLVLNDYSGEGGINEVFLSAGFQLMPGLHLGATVSYYFGQLENKRVQVTEGIAYGTLDERQSDISGFDFNYALTYSPNIGPKHTLFTSLRAHTQTNLTSKNQRRIGTFVPLSGNEIEVIDVDLDSDNLRNTEIKIPTTFSLGLGIGQEQRWMVGGEYSFQQFSDFSNDFLDGDNIAYQDASSYALGGYWIPDFTDIDSYFNRVVYRAGVRLDNTGFIVNEKDISNFGITFGMGFPLGFEYSNLNLGLEVGRRGTTMNNLVRESYFKISIGLSLNASGPNRWFQKRQIN
jgi:hypothetical protein